MSSRPTCPPVVLRAWGGAPRPALWTAGLVLVAVLLPTAPAAAVDDLTAPRAEVTFAPSCGPAVVRVAVVNGTEPVAVTLVTDRAPTGEATAVLAPSEAGELVSSEVPFGVRIEVLLQVTRADGTAAPAIDLGDWTRPSQEDCDALAEPVPGEPTPPAPSAPPTAGVPTPAPGEPTGSVPVPTPAPAPAPTATPGPAATPTPSAEPTATSTSSAPAPVVQAGGNVTIHSSGFSAGEEVTLTLDGGGPSLGTATASEAGVVEVLVQIPAEVAPGVTRVELVGASSAKSADLDLQVASQSSRATDGDPPWPLVATGVGLLAMAVGLAVVGTRPTRSPDAARSSRPGR